MRKNAIFGQCKKVYNRLFSIILTIILLITNSLLVSAGIDKENYLLQKGLPSSIVSILPTSEIDKLYTILQNAEIEITSQIVYGQLEDNANCRYYTNRGTINDNNLEITISSLLQKTDGYITKVINLIGWTWLNGHPAARQEDVIHIMWDSSILTYADSYSAFDFHQPHFSNDIVAYNETNHPAQLKSNELALYTDVYSGLAATRGGFCTFVHLPAHPIKVGTGYSTSIVLTYYHDKSMLPFGNSLSISSSSTGISISFNNLLTDTLGASGLIHYGGNG